MNFSCDRNIRSSKSNTAPYPFVISAHVEDPGRSEPDTRFSDILGQDAWHSLPETIRHRFSKRIEPGHTKIYRGNVRFTRLSRLGWCLAQVSRLFGAPLPLSTQTGRATVLVNEDPLLNGQIWQRTYERPGRFPQVIHSAKRFRGTTGIEEYVGCGIGMSLHLAAENRTLTFTSETYFFEVSGFRLRLPDLLSPGVMKIIHKNEAPYAFSFTLTLDHPWFGRLLEQVVDFNDEEENKDD